MANIYKAISAVTANHAIENKSSIESTVLAARGLFGQTPELKNAYTAKPQA